MIKTSAKQNNIKLTLVLIKQKKKITIYMGVKCFKNNPYY